MNEGKNGPEVFFGPTMCDETPTREPTLAEAFAKRIEYHIEQIAQLQALKKRTPSNVLSMKQSRIRELYF